MAGCNSEGLRYLRSATEEYASEHHLLPSHEAFVDWLNLKSKDALRADWAEEIERYGLKCNRRRREDIEPYVWRSTRSKVNNKAPKPYIWCPKPHGYTRKWRNVLFTDLEMMAVSESDFQRLMRGANKNSVKSFKF